MSSMKATVVRLRVAAAVALLMLVAGCGFRLEGTGALPEVMTRTYIETDAPRSDFTASLIDTLRRRGARVVAARDEADSILRVVADETGQRVLSVSARNIPREFEVYYAVTFEVEAAGRQLIAPESLVVTRAYTFDETQVLAKAAEEEILRQALADDLARRVLRRIEALGATASTAVPQP
jgi:LPS-assembly lipoprotein